MPQNPPSEHPILWCDKTLNPTVGCTPCSPGCDNCYARELHEMRHKAYMKFESTSRMLRQVRKNPLPAQYAKPFSELQFFPDRLLEPLSWKKPRRIFIGSMTDLGHGAISAGTIPKILAMVALAPRHTFLILTKRPEHIAGSIKAIKDMGDPAYILQEAAKEITNDDLRAAQAYMAVRNECGPGCLGSEFNVGWPLRNLHIGLTVVNQEEADAKIPVLLQTPAAVRFLSIEPLLGPIDLTNIRTSAGWINALNGNSQYVSSLGPMLDGVIVGGETGPNARPMHPDWVRSLRDQCAAPAVPVPFFFKSWGEWVPAVREHGIISSVMPDTGEKFTWIGWDGKTQNPSANGLTGPIMAIGRVGKRASGRRLDGREHNDLPGLTLSAPQASTLKPHAEVLP